MRKLAHAAACDWRIKTAIDGTIRVTGDIDVNLYRITLR